MNKSKNSGLRLKKTTLSALGAGMSIREFMEKLTFPDYSSCIRGLGFYCPQSPVEDRGHQERVNRA